MSDVPTLREPRKMTRREVAWVQRLREVLADCPDTVELLTMGDARVQVIDRSLASGDLHDGWARRRGAVLADVESACRVHGVAG